VRRHRLALPALVDDSRRVVDGEALARSLDRLRGEVADPRAGLFGPDSKLWEVNKHSISFLGAGRAALLQLAHPWVAWAIDQHSNTRSDPLGRFRRTFLHVFRMVYGDLDTAMGAARAVHGIHRRIVGEAPEDAGPFAAGSPYRADEPHALLWVHATLWDTSVLCFESVVRPLVAAEKDDYYADTRRFALLFGIPDDVLPTSWEAFAAYNRAMVESDVLTVTPAAREIAGFLFRPLLPGSGPLMKRYAETTAWLLPERLASDFGLERGGAAGERRFEATLRRLRRAWPHLPRRLRYLPPYVDARRRVAGRRDRDPLGELLNRLWVGRARAL